MGAALDHGPLRTGCGAVTGSAVTLEARGNFLNFVAPASRKNAAALGLGNAPGPCQNERYLDAHSRVSPKETVSGLIERVTFFNEENGFAVLRLKVESRRDLITVVGNLPAVSAGEWLTAEGQWVRDRAHGLQLKADTLKAVPPTTREGIEKYLGSGMVKGIGPVYARKLVQHFGEAIFEIIENFSAR